MFIAYYDEAGDDGFPEYSSPLFVLTSLYIHYLDWKEAYFRLQEFRKQLKKDFGLPVKTEFHTKHFLLNKHPYKDFNISDADRILLIDIFCNFLSQLPFKIINVVINKVKASQKYDQYDILDRALTYSIQRIENDLYRTGPTERFQIITDPGRLSKMRNIARKIQNINFIPSKFNPTPYRKEIKLLIEDPLPKDSHESYFIQISDLVSYLVYLHCLSTLGICGFANRMPSEVDELKVLDWMEKIKGILNLEATSSDPYGIVCYPK